MRWRHLICSSSSWIFPCLCRDLSFSLDSCLINRALIWLSPKHGALWELQTLNLHLFLCLFLTLNLLMKNVFSMEKCFFQKLVFPLPLCGVLSSANFFHSRLFFFSLSLKNNNKQLVLVNGKIEDNLIIKMCLLFSVLFIPDLFSLSVSTKSSFIHAVSLIILLSLILKKSIYIDAHFLSQKFWHVVL